MKAKKRAPKKRPKAKKAPKKTEPQVEEDNYCICGSGYFKEDCPCVLNPQYW